MTKIFFFNWISREVNSGVTQVHKQFTHVSRHFPALQREKTVLKMWSQIWSRIAVIVHEISWGKNAKKVKTQKS